MTPITYHSADVDGLKAFYRQAGRARAPKLLLHGYPSASHMFRDLVPQLADRFQVVGADEIQLDLFLDYASNIDLYPQFQDYFRTHQPPLLAIWGRNDPFFLPAGAQAFKRDIPAADVQLLDTGHFALETHADEIATAIRRFLAGQQL